MMLKGKNYLLIATPCHSWRGHLLRILNNLVIWQTVLLNANSYIFALQLKEPYLEQKNKQNPFCHVAIGNMQ
jgi:hypothetical protein